MAKQTQEQSKQEPKNYLNAWDGVDVALMLAQAEIAMKENLQALESLTASGEVVAGMLTSGNYTDDITQDALKAWIAASGVVAYRLGQRLDSAVRSLKAASAIMDAPRRIPATVKRTQERAVELFNGNGNGAQQPAPTDQSAPAQSDAPTSEGEGEAS